MALCPTARRPRSRRSQLRLLLDGVTVALCLFLLSWVAQMSGMYDAYRHDRMAAIATAMLFQIGDLVVLTIAVLVLISADARDRGVLWLLTGGLGVVTFIHAVYADRVTSGGSQSGTPAELGWAAALITFAAARFAEPTALPAARAAASPPTTGR